MGADNGRHEVGDIVIPCTTTLFSGKREIPYPLKEGKTYKITSINRCLDGAYSWDDIKLEGFKRNFCEFDLDTVKRENQ